MPSREKKAGKARRAKGQAANAAAAQTPIDKDLAKLSLGGKEERCDHGGSALQATATALLDAYESELKRLFDAVIDSDNSNFPVQSYLVHCAVMALLQKKGIRVADLGEAFADGLICRGVDWMLQARWHYSQPFSPMATVAAVTHASLVLEGAHEHEEDMNEWGERETVEYFEGMSRCSCLKADVCDHGRPDIPVGSVCWSYMNGLETALIEELGEGCDISTKSHCRKILDATFLAGKRARAQGLKANETFCESSGDVEACLLALGTNLVLADNPHSQMMAGAVACSTLWFRQEDKGTIKRDKKTIDLIIGGPCEWTRFFADRISCSCLAERKKREKSEQKMSQCWTCRTRKKRRELLTCKRCRLADYCSTKCQEAGWERHKATCGRARGRLTTE